VKRRLKLAIAQGCKKEELEEKLHFILADKNMEVHSTTKQIPWEIFYGRLMEDEPENVAELEARIEDMRKDAFRNMVAAAEYAKNQWRTKKGIYTFKVGEKVWVKVPKNMAQGCGDIYQRTAIIAEHKGSDSFRLCWGPEGGYIQGDYPHQLSQRCYSGAKLKPYLERSTIRCVVLGTFITISITVLRIQNKCCKLQPRNTHRLQHEENLLFCNRSV
jgi:hypothetical protein